MSVATLNRSGGRDGRWRRESKPRLRTHVQVRVDSNGSVCRRRKRSGSGPQIFGRGQTVRAASEVIGASRGDSEVDEEFYTFLALDDNYTKCRSNTDIYI